MTDEQIERVFTAVGELKATQSATNGWLHTLDSKIETNASELRAEVYELRQSVDLLSASFLEVMKKYGSQNGNGNGATSEKPPEPGELTKEEKGFWLAVGRVWKRMPPPMRWAILGIFLLGLVISAPTLLRMVPGFKAVQVATDVGPPAPRSRNFQRATP